MPSSQQPMEVSSFAGSRSMGGLPLMGGRSSISLLHPIITNNTGRSMGKHQAQDDIHEQPQPPQQVIIEGGEARLSHRCAHCKKSRVKCTQKFPCAR